MNKADKNLGYLRNVKSDIPCVFISHKNEDQEAALEVGRFLMETMKMDIYLDVFDINLQEAVSVENDAKIVESIKEGINISDILLCIVSDKTRLSWWVPYEIGVADKSNKKIASIRTKNIDDFPSFLKTKPTISNINELIEFMLKNDRYGSLFYEEEKRDKIRMSDVGRMEESFE